LKVQTSFADRLCMGPQNKDLHSLVEGKHKDLEGSDGEARPGIFLTCA